jgi:hypothetical protein
MIKHDDEKVPDHNHNHISWEHPASHNPSYPQAVFWQLTAGAEASYNTRVIEWRKNHDHSPHPIPENGTQPA